MKNKTRESFGSLSAQDYLVAMVIALAVSAFHALNGYPLAKSVLLKSFNWAFDFDSARFVGGWCTADANVALDLVSSFVARHALSLATRPLCLGLALVVGDAQGALMILAAFCAGIVAAVAYFLAAQFCAAIVDRALLAVGFAVSTQPLMLGVIPETYGFALAGIGLHMVLVANKRDSAPAASRASIATFVLNAGFTVTNAVLNVVSSMVLAWNRMSLRNWLVVEAKTWLFAGIFLAVIVVPLAALFMPEVLSNAAAVPKRVWWVININRGEPASLVRVITALVPYGFVAPDFTMVDLKTDGHPMLDFREFRYSTSGGIALCLWFIAVLGGAFFGLRDKFLRRILVIITCWTLLNIALHWFWQTHGSVYLYGAHTSFPLFTLLIMGYGGAVRKYSAPLVRCAAIIMFALAAHNNVQLYLKMIDFVVDQPSVQQRTDAERQGG